MRLPAWNPHRFECRLAVGLSVGLIVVVHVVLLGHCARLGGVIAAVLWWEGATWVMPTSDKTLLTPPMRIVGLRVYTSKISIGCFIARIRLDGVGVWV